MAKLKVILTSIVLTICSIFAFTGSVNAEVINEAQASMDKAMAGGGTSYNCYWR